jgi:hypothetical protein
MGSSMEHDARSDLKRLKDRNGDKVIDPSVLQALEQALGPALAQQQ